MHDAAPPLIRLRSVALVFAIGLITLAAMWSQAPLSDCRSCGYLRWKYELGGWPGGPAWRAFLLDADREALVRGLTRAELAARFQVLLRAGQTVTPYQADYEPEYAGVDHAWLGETPWVVTFTDGRVTDLRLAKG